MLFLKCSWISIAKPKMYAAQQSLKRFSRLRRITLLCQETYWIAAAQINKIFSRNLICFRSLTCSSSTGSYQVQSWDPDPDLFARAGSRHSPLVGSGADPTAQKCPKEP
jgi:hypothetical protein